jgi:hypothetical protein
MNGASIRHGRHLTTGSQRSEGVSENAMRHCSATGIGVRHTATHLVDARMPKYSHDGSLSNRYPSLLAQVVPTQKHHGTLAAFRSRETGEDGSVIWREDDVGLRVDVAHILHNGHWFPYRSQIPHYTHRRQPSPPEPQSWTHASQYRRPLEMLFCNHPARKRHRLSPCSSRAPFRTTCQVSQDSTTCSTRSGCHRSMLRRCQRGVKSCRCPTVETTAHLPRSSSHHGSMRKTSPSSGHLAPST